MASLLASKIYDSGYSLLILLACITALVKSEWCGQPSLCYCSEPIRHAIECTDSHMAIFPFFNDTEIVGVLEVIIHNTGITTLPPFHSEEWMTLSLIDVRNNSHLSCENISKLHRQGLTVISDCMTLLDAEQPIVVDCKVATPPEASPPLSLAITIPAIVMVIVISSLLAYRARKLTGMYHVTSALPPTDLQRRTTV